MQIVHNYSTFTFLLLYIDFIMLMSCSWWWKIFPFVSDNGFSKSNPKDTNRESETSDDEEESFDVRNKFLGNCRCEFYL